jgi:hypothetical protein
MVPMTVDIIEAKSKFQWLMICRRKIGKNGHIVRDGYGIQENLQDGSVYEGMWREEQMCGTGRMTWNNSDVYQGEWKNNKANGHGIFVDSQGSTYDGEWIDDQ